MRWMIMAAGFAISASSVVAEPLLPFQQGREGSILGTPAQIEADRRALAVYISDRDLQQLFVKSIETENIRDEEGIPFQIFYGISGNSHAFWSIANARKIIGYAPQDNSEIRFHDLIQQHITAAMSEE